MPFIDYPAAHSMDTNWFAVDADGRVGLFQAGSDGAYPSNACLGGDVHHAPGPDEEDILRRLLDLQQEADLSHGRTAEGFAQLGVYVFETTDSEHSSPPMPIHENYLAFPYTLTHRPDLPLHIDQVSPEVAALLRAIRLPASRFGAGPTVQPAGQVPGFTWFSYSAVLVAYLDEDGVTIRPIPGQEDEFADYCRDRLLDFPEEAARLVFDPPLKDADRQGGP
jgi:hypothetical protein